jgi:hypothetical protein
MMWKRGLRYASNAVLVALMAFAIFLTCAPAELVWRPSALSTTELEPPPEIALSSSARVCSDEFGADRDILPIFALLSTHELDLYILRVTAKYPFQSVLMCGSWDNFASWPYPVRVGIESDLGPFTRLSAAGSFGGDFTVSAMEHRYWLTNSPTVRRWMYPQGLGNASGVPGEQPSAASTFSDRPFPFIAYQQNRTDGGSSIFFFKSEDYSNNFYTWTTPHRVVGRLDSSASRNETPVTVADASDSIHIAYVRSTSDNREVYYLRNTNRGDDSYWEQDPGRRLSWNATDNHDIAIAASREGSTVLVVWTATNSTGNDDLMYAYSLDGGNTFSQALNLSATVFNEGYAAIAVDVDTSTFHVAYWRNDSIPGRTNNILCTQASWGDPGNWTTPQSVLDLGATPSSDFRKPGIVAYSPGGNHTLDVAWTDARNPSNLDIYMTNVSLMSCEINVNPKTGPVPLNVLLSASASGGTAPYTYTWRLGDGTMGGGPFGAHTYNAPGDYNVAMRVDDAVGNTCFRAVRIRALQIIPDLSVSPSDISFFPPPPQAEVSMIQINATVRNVGGADSPATNARFFDGVPPSPQIGSDQTLPPIPVNGSANVSVTWTASPSGNHQICVVADPDNLVTEIDETNNMACAPFKVLSLADLAPTSMNVTPPSPLLEGTLARVDATIANGGDLPAGAFDVLLFDDKNGNLKPEAGENISLSPLSGLAGHSQENASFDWMPSLVGSHDLCAYADPPPGMVTESNETNNVMCVDVLVQPGPIFRPDYVPVSPLPLPPIKVGLSSTVPFSIEVLNQGNGTATDNAIVAFYEQPSPPFSTSVLSPLAPAATSSRFTATWTSPAIPGTYLVSVDVDHENNVTEWDETNNVYTWTIEVVSGPATSLVIGYPNYTSPAMTTYVKSTTSLSFSVLDQSGLGIRNTTYTIDGGNSVNYTATGTFLLAGEGMHKIEWRSLDWAGNLEEISSMNLTVDDTPPATTINQSDVQATTATVFTLPATDSGSGVRITRYRIDGGEWTNNTTGFTLSEGSHTISFYSIDNLGNQETERSVEVNVTSTPPSVEANYKPLVAAMFAIILILAGVWSSKRRPWKGREGKETMLEAFAVFSLPFVLAEAGTGVVSFLTRQLSIPPVMGAGTAVDLAILMAGILVAILRALKQKASSGE